MKVSEQTVVTVLRMISTNSSIDVLRMKGYAHSQIALLIQDVLEKGYAEISDNSNIALTTSGKKVLSDYYHKNRLHGSAQWIMPQENYRVPQIKKHVIVFPHK